jgi:hypothetical protein
MTVKELIDHLQKYDQTLLVVTACDGEYRKITLNEIYENKYSIGLYKEILPLSIYTPVKNDKDIFECLVLEA